MVQSEGPSGNGNKASKSSFRNFRFVATEPGKNLLVLVSP